MSETKSIIRSVCNRGYNIPMELFKPIASYIASPLTVVRNIQHESFSDMLKIVRINPISQIRLQEQLSDYRLISVTSTVENIREISSETDC